MKGATKMSVKGIPRRSSKVPVPMDVRLAVAELCESEGMHTRNPNRAAKVLHVADCTIAELIDPGGVVQESTLAKVRARLEELKRGAA